MKRFFERLLPYIKDYKLYFFYAIVGTLLVSLATAASAYLVKPVLDDIFLAKDANMLQILPFLVVLAYFSKGLGIYIQSYYMNYIGQDIVKRLKNILLDKMLTFEMGFFNRYRNGELISRITSDIAAVQGAVSNYFIEGIREGLTIFGLVFVVVYQSAELAFYGLIVMPLALYPIALIARKMRKTSKKLQEKNADLSSKLIEIFNNMELIKASSGEKIEHEQFASHNQELFKLSMKSVRISELTSPLMETLGAIAIAAVIFVGGYKVINGELTTGEFFSFTTALFLLYTPFKRLSSLYSKIQIAFAAGDRIFEMLDRNPKIQDGKKELQAPIATISFNNVDLYYGQKQALSNISLEVKRGESIAFVGNSGGGKSSLVNLLLRLYDADNGEVLVNGENIKHFTQNSLRSKIAIVTQRIFIFNDSIARNIAYGSEIDEVRIALALKQARIFDYVQTLPNGIHTELDEFGVNLSGGQRQRIAIARALYKNPEILILDEATSALDNKTEEEFREALSALLEDRIVIIVAHRFSTISLAKRIYFFSQGKILASGTQAELFEKCAPFREYYKSI
ncbi:ABC transporter ATP-binding protein [Helicobacter sp.]|uniref:ABC transporter ATP-binding protein n=1 Tax=Helicobacter sp. TaxID=218 RepID=UPI0025C39350|nr:ABC transporter ATP-binding protein [Helicobacter sp.]MCI5968656.1 ABC transporter ATP-binding protein/permease [Helicobacter sp.]MDY2584478.1 ABC transporter ATP-binding protein [Helicobacter sp.]